MIKITPDQLTTGDVLLYHGTSFFSKIILALDGGNYSHAAIVHDGHMTEALSNGITENTPAASTASAKYVDVYRFVKDGARLGDAAFPVAPLDSAIQAFENSPQRYAYEEILLLALLCSTRKVTAAAHLPGLAMIVRNILETASDTLAKLIAAGREPVICSELVYRCYENSGPNYKLLIRGADIPDAKALAATLQPAAAAELREIHARAAEFLANYYQAKRIRVTPAAGRGTAAAVAVPALVEVAAVADFVTPHDLEASPNLQLIGTLQA
ncbi:MAG: hypothetical protein DMG59_23990 [Acidobacteria bacterium]|jgi:hypothetical protein|nr:MAG: hypothetical protein DMG59_23990 [Acidobacteriota bacterium]